MAFTRFGQIDLKNARHADDPRPLDEASAWPSTRDCARAYLHHLDRAKEILGAKLMTLHNLHYYQAVMKGARTAIEEGRYRPPHDAIDERGLLDRLTEVSAFERFLHLMMVTSFLALVITGGLIVLAYLFSQHLVALFITDPEVIELTAGRGSCVGRLRAAVGQVHR